MVKSGFWALFHEVWGKDSAREFGDTYDKKAWMYVQNRLKEHERAAILDAKGRLENKGQ